MSGRNFVFGSAIVRASRFSASARAVRKLHTHNEMRSEAKPKNQHLKKRAALLIFLVVACDLQSRINLHKYSHMRGGRGGGTLLAGRPWCRSAHNRGVRVRARAWTALQSF